MWASRGGTTRSHFPTNSARATSQDTRDVGNLSGDSKVAIWTDLPMLFIANKPKPAFSNFDGLTYALLLCCG